MKRNSPHILVLGSYPIVDPRHGGQKRVQAVVREYSRAYAHVKYAAIFSRWANPVHAASDIPVSHQTDAIIMQTRELEDIICGESIHSDPTVKKRLTHLLLSFRPDVIQIEQIYVYLGLKSLLAELGLKPKLIYDAHNVESQMKREVYATAGYDQADGRAIADRLAATEQDLARHADLVVAVSPADLEVYRDLGARQVILAPNGMYSSPVAIAAAAEWNARFARTHIKRKILYVCSAHLPNWTGFQDMIGEGLGFLQPDTRILLAGGISDFLENVYAWPKTPGAATFWHRAEPCGRLTEPQLAGLIARSDVIILPITTGGGSNLKTAEALLSGKPIVATSYAFRAFEPFMHFPGVTIADTPEAFRQGILDALQAQPPTWTAEQRTAIQAVTWPHRLAPLVQQVGTL